MGEPAHQLHDDIEPDIRPDLRSLEGGGESSAPRRGHLSSVGGGDEAADSESRKLSALDGGGESTPRKSGHLSVAGGVSETSKGSTDTVGKGFNPAAAATPMGKLAAAKQAVWGSRRRKQASIGSVFLSILLIGGLLLMGQFLSSLKIATAVKALESRFAAASTQAAEGTVNKMFNQYMVDHVFPNIGKGSCKTTVDAGCVSTIKNSDNPVTQMFKAWKEDRLETKLAKRYGLVYGKSGTTYFLRLDGEKINLGNGSSAFGDSSVDAGTRSRIERLTSERIKKGTLWDRVVFHLRYAPFLKSKYGIRHCIQACDPLNKFTDKWETKKQAGKAYVIQRVISPLSESYGLILQCLLDPPACNTTELEPAEEGDVDRRSIFQKKLQTQLDAYAAKVSAEALKDIVAKANEIADKGFVDTITRDFVKKIGTLVGKDLSGDLTTKAIPVIGWVFMIASILQALEHLGPMLQHMYYATNSAAASQLFALYQTTSSEQAAGKVDATQLGSQTDTLSTNMDSSSKNKADITQAPTWQKYATNRNQAPQSYKCDDGKPVPKGSYVCYEEVLSKGNDVVDAISENVSKFVDAIPGVRQILFPLINAINDLLGAIFGPIFDLLCFGPCDAVVNAVGEKLTEFLQWVVNKLIPTAFSTVMSGARIFQMMAGGADVTYNKSCQVTQGCRLLTPAEANNIQTKQQLSLEQEFSERSTFARMFSTDTPYSMVSRLSVTFPSSLSVGLRNMGAILSQPFAQIGNSLSTIFSGNFAFAAVGVEADPFGVAQYGLPNKEIPDKPEQYWAANCAKYYDTTTKKLDLTHWLDKETLDPNTGEAVSKSPNICLALESGVQGGGTMSNNDFSKLNSSIPPTDNPTTTTVTPGVGGGLPSGSAKELAQQLLPYIPSKLRCGVFQPLNCPDIQNTAKGVSIRTSVCVVSAMDARILGMLLKLMQQGYSIQLNALCTDHPSLPGTDHHYGKAADIGAITVPGGTSVSMGGSASAPWTGARLSAAQTLLKDVTSFMPVSATQFGQTNCHPNFSFMDAFYQFTDTCHHIHIGIKVSA